MISDIAATFVTSLAALVTAVATLFLVLEMRRQRRALYKPEFMCEDVEFVARPADSKPIPCLRLSSPASDDGAQSPRSLLFVKCANIGPGPAKRVTYRWGFEAQEIIETIAAGGTNVAGIWLDGTILRIGTADAPARIVHSLSAQNSGFRAVVHARGAEDSITLAIPPAYLDLLGLCLATRTLGPDAIRSLFPWQPPSIRLELSYDDIEDGRHDKRFVLRPDLRMMSGGTGEEASINYAEGVFVAREA